MAKARRGSTRAARPSDDVLAPDEEAGESGGFIGQIGLAETGSGLSHGPLAIVMAMLVAIVAYPVGRLLRALRRRG